MAGAVFKREMALGTGSRESENGSRKAKPELEILILFTDFCFPNAVFRLPIS